MTSLNARALRALGGMSCSLGDKRVTFAGPPGRAQVTAGGEGYVLRATVQEDGSEVIFKVYRSPCQERHDRIAFLSGLELGRHLAAFFAAPLSAVRAETLLPGDDGTPETISLEGLICPFVDGECLSSLFAKGYDPSLYVRARLASQLVSGVRALEVCKLAHGDLAATNVMVKNANDAGAQLVMIDYDGFHHPNVPPIPISTLDSGGRGWGTDGYRSRHFRVGSNTVVSTDRVALAALVFEIMVAQPGDFERLGRDTLVDQGAMDKSGDPAIPPDIQARWARGFSMIRQAFGAKEPLNAPAPSDWLSELQRIAVHGWTSPAPFALRLWTNGQPGRRIMLVSDQRGLGDVVPQLAGLSYVRRGVDTVLFGEIEEQVEHLAATGGQTNHASGAFSTTVSVGDRLRLRQIEIHIE